MRQPGIVVVLKDNWARSKTKQVWSSLCACVENHTYVCQCHVMNCSAETMLLHV